MIAILFRGEELADVERAAIEGGRRSRRSARAARRHANPGPRPAPMARIKGVCRYQILLRSPHRTALRKAVEAVMIGKKWKGVDVAIDVDPINIL